MTEAQQHDVYYAIADPTRRRLLELLSNGEMSVTALAEHFPISRPAISKHLSILRETGLVTEQKVGRERRYQLQPEPLQEVQNWLGFYQDFWNNKLNNFKRLFDKPN